MNNVQLKDWCLANANAIKLDLNGTKVTDLSPLENLVNLRILYLWNTKITNFSPLEKLVNLEWLNLNNTKITDLSPLVGMTNLRTVYLGNTKITDLSPLANLITNGLQIFEYWFDAFVEKCHQLGYFGEIDKVAFVEDYETSGSSPEKIAEIFVSDMLNYEH